MGRPFFRVPRLRVGFGCKMSCLKSWLPSAASERLAILSGTDIQPRDPALYFRLQNPRSKSALRNIGLNRFKHLFSCIHNDEACSIDEIVCLPPLRRLRLLSAYCRRKHGPLRQMQAQRYISPAMDMSITSIATVRHLLDLSQQASRSGTVVQGMYAISAKRGTRNLAAAASRTAASRTQDGSLRTADGGTGTRMDHILQIAGRRSTVPGITSTRRAGCRQAS